MPGFYMDVTVLGGQEDDEKQRIAEEIRDTVRKAAAEAVDKAAREKRESADLPGTLT
jgi:hypothetical protein